jgi:DNA-binding LytR/AlgR family response regulator
MADKKIHCLAVDDEPPALLVMEEYIKAIPTLQLVGVCSNAVETLSVLQNNIVHLLFLDIQMPHILGTDFMRTLVHPPKVIFTTAFRHFAVEGFELDAVDYLLKPISFERFLKAVNKVMNINLPIAEESLLQTMPVKANSDDCIYLRAERKNIKVNFADILFIESLKDYSKVVTKDKTIVTKQAISALEENMPKHLFIRTHRSFIVSLKQIESFTTDLIQIGKYEVPISRSYRHEVEKALAK